MEQKVFVNIKNARGRKPLEELLQKIIDDGKDPFDPEYIAQYHPHPILKIYNYWFVTQSAHPYPGASHHFLVISRTYVELLKELPLGASTELNVILDDINEKYQIEGGALYMRYGNTDLTGATVKRLHGHILAADPNGPGVKIPLK